MTRVWFSGRAALWGDDDKVIFEIASLGKTYVEIGTLFGGSACLAGLAGCEVFCIDPLDGYYVAKHMEVCRPDPHTQMMPSEEIVRENWNRAGLDSDKLHIYKQLHPPWPDGLDKRFDVGFIDGDHRYQGIYDDYMGMAPRVTYLMFHDFDKPAVRAVVDIAIASGAWEGYIPEAGPITKIAVLKRRQT